MKKTLLLIFMLNLFLHFSIAQNNKIDSLLTILTKAKEDTLKVNTLNALAWEYNSKNTDTALILSKQAFELATKILNESKDPIIKQSAQIGIGSSDCNRGWFYFSQGDYISALEYSMKAIDLWNILEKKTHNNVLTKIKNQKSKAFGNIAAVYYKQGQYPKSLDYYFKAMKIAEELKNKIVIASNLGNIGLIYDDQGDYSKALEYYLKALKLREELGNKNYIAIQLGNIGVCYKEQADVYRSKGDTSASVIYYSKALDYYFKALKINEELGIKKGISKNYGNIGNVYNVQEKYTEALDYFLKALRMAEELKSKSSIAIQLANLGSLYTQMGNKSLSKQKELYTKAEASFIRSLAICDSIGLLNIKMDVEVSISELYEQKGDFKKSLEHYKKSTIVRDTIFNKEKNDDITRKAMSYEFNKKEEGIKAENDKHMAIADEDKRRQRLFLWFTVFGLLLMALVALVIFRSLRVTRKQKNIIELQKYFVEQQKQEVEYQKTIVEEHQKEIIDSITYARRIQQSLLPTDKYIERTINRLKKKNFNKE